MTATPISREWDINREAAARRAKVSAKDKKALSDIYEWERQQRIDAGLHVLPYPKPFSRHELDTMPADIRKMGLAHGFLEYRDGQLVEIQSQSPSER
jgi:hypothetical protein